MSNTTKIKALIKECGKEPRIIEVPNTLHAFQEIVGGYIEPVTFSPRCVVICDEEGRLKKSPYNCTVVYRHKGKTMGSVDFVGTILIVSSRGENFDDFGTPCNTAGFLYTTLALED